MVENHASGSSSSQAEKGNGGERLITDISEIIRLDERLWDVTRGLPIKLGSLTRLPSDSYLNWGIGLTDENKAELASMSRFWYDKDIEEDMAHDFCVKDKEELMLTRQMESIQARMKRSIAHIVSSMSASTSTEKEKLVIADISAKDSSLCYNIITDMMDLSGNPDIHKKLEFHIINPSARTLESSKRLLKDLGVRTTLFLMDGGDYLKEQEPGSIDFIVSLPFLHRKSFHDYAVHMEAALSPGGAAVIGDFHSPLFSHPFNVYRLLDRMGLDPRRLDMFKEIFGKRLIEQSYSGLNKDELKALESHMSDWCRIEAHMRASRRIGNQRLFLLSAHDTSKDREEKFRSAGLTVYPADIRKAFTLTNQTIPSKMEKSDYAVVMVAFKQPKSS